MNVAELLKNKRIERGISISQFAMDMSINKINLYKIEASKNLSEKTIQKYCFALGIKIEDLFKTAVELPNKEAVLYGKLENYNLSLDMGVASLNRRMGRNRGLSFSQISKLTGIPQCEMEGIEDGIWNGSLQHLIMYLRYIGAEISIDYTWNDEIYGISKKLIEEYKADSELIKK